MQSRLWLRVMLAIALIGAVAAPYSVCFAAGGASPDSCCDRVSGSAATWSTPSCCKPNSATQQAVTVPVIHTDQASVSRVADADPLPVQASATPALHTDLLEPSPPPGSFVLRI